MAEDEYDEFAEHDPIDDHAEAIDPDGQDHLPASSHRAVSSARIVYCTSCGCQLDGLRIGEPCPSCGVPVGSGQSGDNKSSGKAIASLVLGICSIVGCLFYGLPGIVCGILAIIFARQTNRDIKANIVSVSSQGMANAGRICGIVGLSLSVAFLLLIIAYFVFVFVWLIPQSQQNTQPSFQSHPVQTTPAQPTPTP